ncbi:MAG: hypothetical protein IJ521_06225 [Schwartzia sp.]|nr:hypothetical protein [Schwartzia sp. (in: firmicutes)]
MIEIEVSRASAKALEEQLAALKGEKVYAAMSQAAKRAASHAKRIGTKHVRQTYTIDAASVKAATSIRGTQGGAVLRIAGPRKSAGHYKAKKRKGGIFVSVKKGSGDIVPRSFAYSNTFFKRQGKDRLPIERIFGPAVPQLFGNDAIKEEIAAEAMKKYEERIRHEVGRLIGG